MIFLKKSIIINIVIFISLSINTVYTLCENNKDNINNNNDIIYANKLYNNNNNTEIIGKEKTKEESYDKDKETGQQNKNQTDNTKKNNNQTISTIITITLIMSPAIIAWAKVLKETFEDEQFFLYKLFKKKEEKPKFNKTIKYTAYAITAIVLFYLLTKHEDKYGNSKLGLVKVLDCIKDACSKGKNNIIKITKSIKNIFLKDNSSINFSNDLKTASVNFYTITAKEPPFNEPKLHKAVRNGNFDAVKTLIENGADIWERNNTRERPLNIAYKKGQKEIIDLLIKNGAHDYNLHSNNHTPISSKIDEFRSDIDPKYLKNRPRQDPNSFIDQITKFINSDNAPYELQTGLYYLTLEQKNFNVQVSPELMADYFKKIQFNQRFFKSKKFKDLIKYAQDNNLKDINGNTILHAIAKYSKDHDLVLNFIKDAYERISYSSNEKEKTEILNEINLIHDNAKKCNKKLYIKIRNLDFILHDLEYGNLLNKTRPENKERMEEMCVKSIVDFIGNEDIYQNKIFYNF